jgi:hypothetical protein
MSNESKLLKTRLVEAGLQARVERLEAELERLGAVVDNNREQHVLRANALERRVSALEAWAAA